ncbi:hypothetical protein SETIT_1G117400v2 [Setaria italica]|uniref:Uncharacterized protein n=1 Tax=Setaria italica TaxID=4555 RepID=A0A368PJA8_SETIT|nr:hypothetical protein SETIT_1G117400v2 [Setaria italica]RCV05871.1 hypothetical protein SETIT_1G117400v2 [Setaria italica]
MSMVTSHIFLITYVKSLIRKCTRCGLSMFTWGNMGTSRGRRSSVQSSSEVLTGFLGRAEEVYINRIVEYQIYKAMG